MRIIILSLLALLTGACSPNHQADPTKYSDALIVLNGAKGITYSQRSGIEEISYEIKTRHPSDSEIKELYRELEKRRWSPLEHDFFNTNLPSSHVRGWTQFLDSTVKPQRQVHQWLAQWSNDENDLLWCTLRYSYRDGATADLDNLEVSLIFIPADLAAMAKYHAEQGR